MATGNLSRRNQKLKRREGLRSKQVKPPLAAPDRQARVPQGRQVQEATHLQEQLVLVEVRLRHASGHRLLPLHHPQLLRKNDQVLSSQIPHNGRWTLNLRIEGPKLYANFSD